MNYLLIKNYKLLKLLENGQNRDFKCASFNEIDIEIIDKLKDRLQIHSSLKTQQSKISSFFK